MKKLLLFFLLLFSILINQKLIFADEIKSVDRNDQAEEITNLVSDLLEERSELWNKMFSMDCDTEKIYEDLNEIVADPLLTYDIEAFKKIKADCTDMDKILDINVEDIDKIDIQEDGMKFEAKIEWSMENLDSTYKEKVSYKMELVKEEDKWKIKDYSLK